MKTSLNCPQGHTWQIEPSVNGATHACPTCGAAAALVPEDATVAPDSDPLRTVPPKAADTQDAPTVAPSAASTGERRGSSPPCVSGYELLAELGRGGMGVVYQARHRKLNRVVALKMILAGSHAGAADLARFQTEAEAIARLQHPNIVQVYEVGEHEGKPFFSLELCGGGSLAQKLNGTPLPAREAAALLESLARAMQAAHDQQIIHRDLKPANVLLTETGIPKITDFGLAKKLDEAGQTQTGAIMGTPSYMAPEQAGGKPGAIGPAADVYALGALLYECLTGRPPFKAATALDTIMQVVSDDPVPPRQLNAKLPADLETVCLKCLHKEPAKRYRTAAALAEDLRHFQAGEPVQARPVGSVERARKWINRHRALSALGLVVVLGAAAVLLALGLGTGVATYFAIAANAEVVKTQDLLATSTMMLARSHFEENQAALAEDLLEKVPGKFRSSGWGLLKSYIQGSLFTLRGHTGQVMSVAFAADGRVLASAGGAEVKLWDTRTGQELHTLRGHSNAVTSVAFSADGELLASAGGAEVKLWDARTGQARGILWRGHRGGVTSVAFAAHGQVLASASDDKTVKLWDVRTGKELHTLHGHTNNVASVAFAANGEVLASASHDKTVKLWDVRTGKELHTLRGHTKEVTSVALSADGQVLASASAGMIVNKQIAPPLAPGELKLWDARTGQELRTLRGHTNGIMSVAFSADGQTLASASRDTSVKLWDVRTGQELRTLRGHANWVMTVTFAGDGQLVASAGGDQTVKLWDARTGQELRTLRGHTQEVTSVAFAADSQVLASASDDKTAKLWDPRTGQELVTLRGHTSGVSSVALAADGQKLASASEETVKLWDARTGQELRTLRGHAISVHSVAFTADGQVLASAGGQFDGTVQLWDVQTGAKRHTLLGQKAVLSVAFAANGQVLASARGDQTVKLWDARTGQELHTLRGALACVAFAADGRLLASAGADNTVKLWDTRTGQELRALRGHTQPVTSVAFAADGQVLASASGDGTVKLWDTRTGQELRTLRGHTQPVTSVAFAADGQVLASASQDGTVKFWDTRTGQDQEKERRFRLCVTAPDLHLNRNNAEAADKDKQPFALAFRLGRYLAGKTYYAANPKDEVKPPFSAPTFPDGIACTGVLYKDSGIAPARLLSGTSRALEGDPANWLNHAFHGGALFRNGEHAKALAALTDAAKLRGKPSPLTHNLLALVSLKMGQKDKAQVYLKKAAPTKDAPWEDVYLQRLLQPEVDAALAKADGTVGTKEK